MDWLLHTRLLRMKLESQPLILMLGSLIVVALRSLGSERRYSFECSSCSFAFQFVDYQLKSLFSGLKNFFCFFLFFVSRMHSILNQTRLYVKCAPIMHLIL